MNAVLIVACFMAQFFALKHYIKIMYPKIGWNTLASKALCSGLFVLTAVIAGRASGGEFAFNTMTAAFICSFFGDIFLHMYPKLGSVFVNYALGGLSFLAGHVLLVMSFFNLCSAYNPEAPLISAGEIVAAAILCVAVNVALRLFGLKLGKFTVPIIIYSLALMTMVVKAVSAAVLMLGGATDFGVFRFAAALTLSLGAILFAASDIVLATDFFSGGKDLKKKKANMILYYGGQMLLALSLLWIEF